MASLDLAAAGVHLVLPCPSSQSSGDFRLARPSTRPIMAAAGSGDLQGSSYANVPSGYRPSPRLRPENDPGTY
eukprot:12681700-Alexandrium_andersonii.AAC.1